MSPTVWYAIPSARPLPEAEACFALWRACGYAVAVWRDAEPIPQGCNLVLVGKYPGYAQAINALCREILSRDPNVQWIVTGGDDTEPDQVHIPEQIAAECSRHFAGTFGIMQPTGDRFAGGSIDRIAGSPWIGRDWCQRANGGGGAFWPEFTHMFGDECLKRTAEKLGVYWMRPDLIQLHHHFMRETGALDSKAVPRSTPAHLLKWNGRAHWEEMQGIFRRLEAQDFNPCLPLPVGIGSHGEHTG